MARPEVRLGDDGNAVSGDGASYLFDHLVGTRDIVILDNLGSHRGKAVRQLIRSVGAKLFFLPKYSPDLNPIEQVFAKLKHLIRKAAARIGDAVCAGIGQALRAFTSEE